MASSVRSVLRTTRRCTNPKLRAQFPTFKRKQGKQSSYHCVGVKVLEGAVKLPKLSPIKARIHREIAGEVKSITLSRKQKGSANRGKARLRLAAVHERVANARADFQHKLSRTMVDENQALIVETLKSANMMKNHRDINAALNIQRKGTRELQAAGLVVSAHGGQCKSVIKTVAA